MVLPVWVAGELPKDSGASAEKICIRDMPRPASPFWPAGLGMIQMLHFQGVTDSHCQRRRVPGRATVGFPHGPLHAGPRIFSGKENTVLSGRHCCRNVVPALSFGVFFLEGSFSGRGRDEKQGCRVILGDGAGCVGGFSMLEAAPTHACGFYAARGGVMYVECRRAQKERA